MKCVSRFCIWSHYFIYNVKYVPLIYVESWVRDNRGNNLDLVPSRIQIYTSEKKFSIRIYMSNFVLIFGRENQMYEFWDLIYFNALSTKENDEVKFTHSFAMLFAICLCSNWKVKISIKRPIEYKAHDIAYGNWSTLLIKY